MRTQQPSLPADTIVVKPMSPSEEVYLRSLGFDDTAIVEAKKILANMAGMTVVPRRR